MSTIGSRIKTLRKELKLKQDDLSKLLGIKSPAISKFECDRVVPTEAALKLICATYHVNYMWLTEGVGDMLQDESIDDMVDRIMAGESVLAREIMKAFARLPDDEWRRFMDVVEQVKKNGPLV